MINLLDRFMKKTKAVAVVPQRSTALVLPNGNVHLNLFTQGENPKLKEIFGSFVAILGIRGSGKSNAAAVFAEELLNKQVPLTIVDIDGEHTGLKKEYPMIKVVDHRNNLALDQVHDFVRRVLENNVPVLLDVHSMLEEERDALLKKYFEEMWEQEEHIRTPHVIMVEEAHEFLPQGRTTPIKPILNRIALRGRKRGLSALLITQRSAKIDKDSITQADHQILMRVAHPSDLKVYMEILPFTSNETKGKIKGLGNGEALYVHNGIQHVRFRLRRTPSTSGTPGAEKLKGLGRFSMFG